MLCRPRTIRMCSPGKERVLASLGRVGELDARSGESLPASSEMKLPIRF